MLHNIQKTNSEPKEKKEKRAVGMRAMASMCAACVILSGAAGFGGRYLADRITTAEPAAQTAEIPSQQRAASDSSAALYQQTDVTNLASKSEAPSGSEQIYAQVAAQVKDSVVEINTEYKTENSWFQFTTDGAGSGVILTEDGYIVTNAHVILDSSQQKPADKITVRLTDGTEYAGEVKAYDTDEDIAIVKIDAKKLATVKYGDSDKLVVGEELLIVGNPLGELGGTVTKGIVSATEREIQVGGVTMHLIQTDAAVNPGNSGGGMFNMNGELVGIVNAKSSGSGIEGLGFAIPVNKALSVSEELMTKGYVSGKPTIGVSLEDTADDMGSYFFFFGSRTSDVKPGVYVRGLVEGMNDKVLKEGDRIIAINGEEITSSSDVKAIVSKSAIGDKLKFQLYRDNKLREVEVTVFERTPDGNDASSSGSDAEKKTAGDEKKQTTRTVIGVSMQEFSGNGREGVYITSVEKGMNDKVLKTGDRIVAVNGEEITSAADVKSAVESAKAGDKLSFQVFRDGKLIPVEVTVYEQAVEEGEETEAAQETPEEDGNESSENTDLFEFFKDFFNRR